MNLKGCLRMKIKTKKDCEKVIECISKDQALFLFPNGFNGNLCIGINSKGCREFWNDEEGNIGENTIEEIISTLWKYRKAFNDGNYKIGGYPEYLILNDF